MQEINWTLEPREADIVMNALMARPWGEVNGLIQKLMQQAQRQPEPASNEAPSPEA